MGCCGGGHHQNNQKSVDMKVKHKDNQQNNSVNMFKVGSLFTLGLLGMLIIRYYLG